MKLSFRFAFPGLAACLFPLLAPAANEQAFQALWDRHLASQEDHAAVERACSDFAAQNPGDPLVPVAAEIRAWHLLKSGKIPDATAILQSLAGGGNDPVAAGASLVARGWLTRLDRERFLPVLQAYYRQEVSYPPKLADLFNHPKVPAAQTLSPADRFGDPWDYRLTGFAKVPGFLNQKFELQSRRLGAATVLAAALKAPYGLGVPVKPSKVLPGTPAMVVFEQGAAVGAIAPGQQLNGIHLAFLGERIIAVCNHTAWMVFPVKP